MEKKSWDEFRETGLLCFVNTFLHIFGWCIVIEKDGETTKAYPARVNYTGFSEEVYEKNYKKVRSLLKETIEVDLMEKITLKEFAKESGLSWVLEEPETYYRYKYDEMTYEEWSKLFD